MNGRGAILRAVHLIVPLLVTGREFQSSFSGARYKLVKIASKTLPQDYLVGEGACDGVWRVTMIDDEGETCLRAVKSIPLGGKVRLLVKAVLSRHGSLPEGVVHGYFHQVMMGVVYLHANRVIMRDIKLGNILMNSQNA
ncbi:hypothetical protein BSKO_05778 [Bryopsis sp. KO-2023]|nr:hypothetical protein BSKO_05778 [Bryopsis sp. KO-2023]